MPIVVHLDRLLDKRGLTVTELSNRIGLTVANLSILKTGKARAIRFSTLEAVCRELDCQPGELLERVGDERDASADPDDAERGPEWGETQVAGVRERTRMR